MSDLLCNSHSHKHCGFTALGLRHYINEFDFTLLIHIVLDDKKVIHMYSKI